MPFVPIFLRSYRLASEHLAVCKVISVRPQVAEERVSVVFINWEKPTVIRKNSRITFGAIPITQHVANNHLPQLAGGNSYPNCGLARKDVDIIFQSEAGDADAVGLIS